MMVKNAWKELEHAMTLLTFTLMANAIKCPGMLNKDIHTQTCCKTTTNECTDGKEFIIIVIKAKVANNEL